MIQGLSGVTPARSTSSPIPSDGTPAASGAFMAQATAAACRELADEAIEAVTVVKDALARLPKDPAAAAKVLNGWAPNRPDGTPQTFGQMLSDMLEEAEAKLEAVANQCKGLLGPAEMKEVERKRKAITPLRGLLDGLGGKPSSFDASKIIEAAVVFGDGLGKLFNVLRSLAR